MAEEQASSDQILARGMTPEAYYSKLQRASLFQGALTDAVPAVVDLAGLLKEPWELVQAKLDLKKSKATEKGIPLDVQDARIDAAVGKTQQIVSQQSRAISDQLAMNPSPAKRKQLLAQQAKLAATVGVASAQVGAQVGVQSAEVARGQVEQEQQLEKKIAGKEQERGKEKTGAFLKSFLAATNIWAATRAPADFGTHLLEEQTKFEGKAGRVGDKIKKLRQPGVELEAKRADLQNVLNAPLYEKPSTIGPPSAGFDAKKAQEKTLERYDKWMRGEAEALSSGEEEKFQARYAGQVDLDDIKAKITAYNQKNDPRIANLQERQAGFTQQAGVAQTALAQHQENPSPFPNPFAMGVRGGMPGVSYPYLMYGQPTSQAQSSVPEGWIFDTSTGTFKPPRAQ